MVVVGSHIFYTSELPDRLVLHFNAMAAKTLTVVAVIQLKLHRVHEELPTQFIGLRAFIKLCPHNSFRYIGREVVRALTDCLLHNHQSFLNACSVPR